MNEIIEDYFMNPRNIGALTTPDVLVNVGNPVCGDTINMGLTLKNNKISEVLFKAYGCSTSIATASIISEFIKNKTIDELKHIDRDAISNMLGELEPKERHCIDIGAEMVLQVIENVGKHQTKFQ